MAKKVNEELTRSLKKYLKVISDIELERGIVRVKEIAKRMNVSMSSVSTSLKKLTNLGYIDYEKHFFVKFTFKGKALADKFHYNSTILYRFLIDVLKVDENTARIQADEICVDIIDDVMSKLEEYLNTRI
ncbi:MAG: metal-dependent transcriptional regulator [Brevinematales bacterium]|nr:metal-dependent transcriptional regulator [Brevinematales bacterium]